MMQLGFREATRSGLSFGTDDLVTPDTKVQHIGDAEKKVMPFISSSPFPVRKKKKIATQPKNC